MHAHAFRHGAATRALAAGASLPDVSKLLGHSSTAVTAGTYSHAVDDSIQRASAAAAAAVADL